MYIIAIKLGVVIQLINEDENLFNREILKNILYHSTSLAYVKYCRQTHTEFFTSD